MSIFHLFSSPHPSQLEPYTPTPAPIPGMTRQTTLSRGRSITQRFNRIKNTLKRPFELWSQPPNSAYPMVSASGPSAITATNGHFYQDDTLAGRIANTAHRVHATIRQPDEPTILSMAMRSDNSAKNPDTIALPFRLSIGHLHDKTQRNVPYLRQSWSRIDFIAIVSFWITFVLAISGSEKGSHHVGVFRAMSVIRTARLLTITSGTTVSYVLNF